MAFPTAVNEQVTDAVQNSAENTQASLPEKIIQMSSAFAQTLEMENTVFQNQINGIVNMVLNAMQRLAELDGDTAESEAAKTDLRNLVGQLKETAKSEEQTASNGKAAALALTPTNPNEQTLETALVQSISDSYRNAVNAQNQMYITMQAAATMTITTILSIDTEEDTMNMGTNHTLNN